MPGDHRNEMPPQAVLEKMFDYNPETGELNWKSRTPDMFQETTRSKEHACAQWNSRWAGKPALNKVWKGYKIGRLNYQYVASHRIIWKLMTGDTPDMIDHQNGVRDDNRFENLRNVNESENRKNTRRRVSKRPYTGVMKDKRTDKWIVQIQVGTYEDLEEAIAARKNAEFLLGYHQNHSRDAA